MQMSQRASPLEGENRAADGSGAETAAKQLFAFCAIIFNCVSFPISVKSSRNAENGAVDCS